MEEKKVAVPRGETGEEELIEQAKTAAKSWQSFSRRAKTLTNR